MRERTRLRSLALPRPVRVEADEEGGPVRVHLPISPGRRGHRRRPRILKVLAVREEWRIDDEWWRQPISRRYWTVVLEDGRLITLYRDLLSSRWFVQDS